MKGTLRFYIYISHVAFFTISGYLFNRSYTGNSRLHGKQKNMVALKKKNIDLIVSYAILTILYWVTKYPFNTYMLVLYTPIDLLLLFIKPIGVYWYLWVLIMYYLIFEKINCFQKHSGRRKILLSGLLAINLLVSLFRTHINYYLYMLFWNAIMFYIGCVLEENGNLARFKQSHVFPLITMLGIALTLFIVFDYQVGYVPLIGLIVTITLVFLYLLLSVFFHLEYSKILSYCGKESFIIYAFHVYFCTPLSIIYGKLRSWPSGGGGGIITAFISIISPLLVSNILRRIGIYDFIFKTGTAYLGKTRRVL